MWHYESRTPKPTVLWSSSRAITKFWLGRLKRSEVLAKAEHRNPQRRGPPVKRWQDKEGRSRFQGTFDLRQYTAAFGQKIASELHSLIKFTPRLNHDDELQSREAIDIWNDWEWGDMWHMADMIDFVHYLYGAKALAIPSEWRPVLPKEL
ncbi:unnamed protein product [Symbiodinium microadriaticum]|nr:unnamed protein product [Symbiodinium microadriaticum]CAE7661609.1 unnamed protein product [Symbiodinium sp. KB8]